MARLGDICTILNGYAFKSEKYVNQGVRIIRIANVQKGYIEDNTPQFYPENSEEDISKYMLRNGDLLLSLTGNVGRVAILTKDFLPAALNQRVACLRAKVKEVDPFYLYHYLNSDFFERECVLSSKGVAQKNMSTEWLKEYDIPLRPMEQQQNIASTLDKVSGLISLRMQQLAKLDELVEGRFVEMFGDPAALDNPNEWPLVELGDCCTINPKKNLDCRLTQNLAASFVPMTAVSENGALDASDVRKYSDVKTGFTYFAENDVLFAKITPCMENGKSAIAQGLCNGIGFGSTEFHILRPIPQKSHSHWLYTLIKFKQFRIDAEKNMTGSAGQKRVPASYLESYKVVLPPIDLQNQFAFFAEAVGKRALTIQQSLDKLEVLKKALMQEYFG